MTITPEYKKLKSELNAGELPILAYKILELLSQAPSGLSRRELVRKVFGGKPITHLGNDTRDRKIRKGIESLRDKGIPIVSTSGKAGYRLETDPQGIADMLDEMRSRIAHLERKVQAIQHFSTSFTKPAHRDENAW